MVTELSSNSTTLLLQADDSGWCRVSLIDNGRRNQLGGEVRAVLVDRLLRGLQDELHGPSAGTFEGVNLVGVLSLAEQHTSVYAADVEGNRLLYFQNADGRMIAQMSLTDETRLHWIALLTGEG